MTRSRQKHPAPSALKRSLQLLRLSNPTPLEPSATPPPLAIAKAVKFRPYQWPVFADCTSGILVLHWSRQVGKSHTLAAWALARLLTRPGRLVTVLSNSRDNGAEFLAKCAAFCHAIHTPVESDSAPPVEDLSMELRVTVAGQTGRIKVLAANPRTARGFSGDLILDEFAFHENSAAIWEAAEPILSSNPDFLCRIASTGNGKYNLFHQFASPASETEIRRLNLASASLPDGPGMTWSRAGFRLSRVPRSLAHELGVPIYDPATRAVLTPFSARSRALDKAAYDQNYECIFADENLTLLSDELISAAETDGIGAISSQEWPASTLELLNQSNAPLFAGFDVARNGDLSVITVVEKNGDGLDVRAILRMRGMRLPEQQRRLGEICRLPRFQRAAIDMTGLGWGLVEFAQQEFGIGKILGINFASSVPITPALLDEGRRAESVRVTEALALELLRVYENRRIRHPRDSQLRADLRKPERITSPGGRVSIAATRDEAGHADHFWSLALAVEAAGGSGNATGYAAQPIRSLAQPRELF